MSKTFRRDDNYDDYRFVGKRTRIDKFEYENKKKEKKLENAIRSKNWRDMMDEEDDN